MYSKSLRLVQVLGARSSRLSAGISSVRRLFVSPHHRQVKVKFSRKTKARPTESFNFDDLPKEAKKIEGSPPPLTVDQQFDQAVNEDRVPNTDLAKVVFRNWRRFPDCIVLTRVGKFYESYFEPAVQVSDVLNIKLAYKRYSGKNGKSLVLPFAGFPVHQIDKYLKLLVQDLGHTVALVEEYDKDPAQSSDGNKKDRRVGRVVTPGTLIDESWLSGGESGYLLAISVSDEPPVPTGVEGQASLGLWLAYTDASTGEFYSKETTAAQLEDELARILPQEIVLDISLKQLWNPEGEFALTDNQGSIAQMLDLFRVMGVRLSFADTYREPNLDENDDAPGIDTPAQEILTLEARSITLLRHYLQYALRDRMPSLSQARRELGSANMHIDAATLNALEIRHTLRLGDPNRASPLSSTGSLLSVLDRTTSPSGRRLLLRTLTAPLTSPKDIASRQSLVQALFEREDLREEIQEMLKSMKDIMRLVQKFKGSRGQADELWDTGKWIRGSENILARIQQEIDAEAQQAKQMNVPLDASAGRLQDFIIAFRPLTDLAKSIEAAIDEEALVVDSRQTPSSSVYQGDNPEESAAESEDSPVLEDVEMEFPPGMTKSNKVILARARNADLTERRYWWIRPTFSPELESLHARLVYIRGKRDKMQSDLRKTFKVNDKDLLLLTKSPKYGHSIHVSRKDDRTAMCKVTGFHSPSADQKALIHKGWTNLGFEKENVMEKLFQEQYQASRTIRQMVVELSESVHHNSTLIDELDLAMSFAQTAGEMGYVRPTVTSGTEFHVVNGRHPSVEAALHSSARLFTPNSTDLSPESHLHVITGPNQGGKSTYLRQNAVIAILAQSGSFVPADHADIGVVDKVFSRIGARDDLFRDRSTFMLEMVETAAILRYATEKSLVIMDEIGRGTTLQAGISIAYATLDYILSHIKCRTLFATHYHELGKMLKERDAGERHQATDEQGNVTKGIGFWCTDVDEMDGAFSYSYRLKPGLNFNSHAMLAARMAGMPQGFLKVATDTLRSIKEVESEMAEAVEKAEKGKRDNDT